MFFFLGGGGGTVMCKIFHVNAKKYRRMSWNANVFHSSVRNPVRCLSLHLRNVSGHFIRRCSRFLDIVAEKHVGLLFWNLKQKHCVKCTILVYVNSKKNVLKKSETELKLRCFFKNICMKFIKISLCNFQEYFWATY